VNNETPKARASDISNFTIERLQNKLFALTSSRKFLIAYSGGLDSHVLLYSLMRLRHNQQSRNSKGEGYIQIRAIHVNHGLSPHAELWVAYCKQVCLDWNVDFISRPVFIQTKSNESIEALAREARYTVISQLMYEDEVLLTAHNQNDQVETLLLQLMRGAGPRGLAAMPEKKPFGRFNQSELIRPLLHFPRERLYEFAKEEHLTWVEDESNQNVSFDRNYLRQKLMPVLEEKWPGFLKSLSRSAEHCAESFHLLDEMADKDLKNIQDESGHLNIQTLLKLTPERQRNALRRWLHLADVPMPETVHLKHIQKDLLLARKDAQPEVSWNGVVLRRYQNKLFLLKPLRAFDAKIVLNWDLKSPLNLPNHLGQLHFEPTKGEGLSQLKLKGKKISVKFRQGGEKMYPSCRNKGTTLKHLFQEWQVPSWQRERIPLIFCEDELIAVVGFDVDKKFMVDKNETGINIVYSE